MMEKKKEGVEWESEAVGVMGRVHGLAGDGLGDSGLLHRRSSTNNVLHDWFYVIIHGYATCHTYDSIARLNYTRCLMAWNLRMA